MPAPTGVRTRDARAACANGLGERPLRQQRRLDLAAIHGRDRLGIGGEVRGDPAADPPLAQELAEPLAGLADVVRDDRQIGRVGLLDERVEQRQRSAHEPEPADHHGVSRAHVTDGLLRRGEAPDRHRATGRVLEGSISSSEREGMRCRSGR